MMNKILEFVKELEILELKYNLNLIHEDLHGSFLIYDKFTNCTYYLNGKVYD